VVCCGIRLLGHDSELFTLGCFPDLAVSLLHVDLPACSIDYSVLLLCGSHADTLTLSPLPSSCCVSAASLHRRWSASPR
jgi:hypothetical protein